MSERQTFAGRVPLAPGVALDVAVVTESPIDLPLLQGVIARLGDAFVKIQIEARAHEQAIRIMKPHLTVVGKP